MFKSVYVCTYGYVCMYVCMYIMYCAGGERMGAEGEEADNISSIKIHALLA